MTELSEMERNIYEMFEAASSMILQDSIDEAEFQLCSNTIMITIEYLEAKRMRGLFLK